MYLTDLIKQIQTTAARETAEDNNEDFLPYDVYGGNIDEAYWEEWMMELFIMQESY